MRCVGIMRWWCSNIGQVPLHTYAPSLSLNLFLVSLAPPDSNVFWILISLHRTYSYRPPSITILHRSTLYVAPASLPQLTQARIVHPYGHLPHPPASTTYPCVYLPCRPRPSHQVPPGPWSPASHTCEYHVPCPFVPPFPPSACTQVPVSP